MLKTVSAYSRSKFSEDLIRQLPPAYDKQQLDQIIDQALEQLDTQAVESASLHGIKGWQIWHGPFSVLYLVMDFEPMEALDNWQSAVQYSEPLDSMDGAIDSTLLQQSIDWTSSIPQGTSVSQALLADLFPGDRLADPSMNATYTPLIPGRCHVKMLRCFY